MPFYLSCIFLHKTTLVVTQILSFRCWIPHDHIDIFGWKHHQNHHQSVSPELNSSLMGRYHNQPNHCFCKGHSHSQRQATGWEFGALEGNFCSLKSMKQWMYATSCIFMLFEREMLFKRAKLLENLRLIHFFRWFYLVQFVVFIFGTGLNQNAPHVQTNRSVIFSRDTGHKAIQNLLCIPNQKSFSGMLYSFPKWFSPPPPKLVTVTKNDQWFFSQKLSFCKMHNNI